MSVKPYSTLSICCTTRSVVERSACSQEAIGPKSPRTPNTQQTFNGPAALHLQDLWARRPFLASTPVAESVA